MKVGRYRTALYYIDSKQSSCHSWALIDKLITDSRSPQHVTHLPHVYIFTWHLYCDAKPDILWRLPHRSKELLFIRNKYHWYSTFSMQPFRMGTTSRLATLTCCSRALSSRVLSTTCTVNLMLWAATEHKAKKGLWEALSWMLCCSCMKFSGTSEVSLWGNKWSQQDGTKHESYFQHIL